MAKGLWPVINVDNVEKSVEWYKMLGLKAKNESMDMPGGGAQSMGTVDLGESGLVIWSKHVVAPDQAGDTKAWVSGELGKGVLFTIGVGNAQKLWANAQKMRAEIDSPLEAQPWGGHGFNVVDPDGYVISITDKFPGTPPPKAKLRAANKRVTPARSKNAKAKAKGKRKGR